MTFLAQTRSNPLPRLCTGLFFGSLLLYELLRTATMLDSSPANGHRVRICHVWVPSHILVHLQLVHPI